MVLVKAGYDIYLVYEKNTSKYNFLTGELNEKFRKRLNPKSNKNNIILWHGLLRSKIVPNSKSANHMLVNRDFNGSMNIHKKVECIIKNIEMPIYLQ